MTDLHVVVRDTVDHPEQPSGGNTYDRRMSTGFRSLGWTIHEHAVPGRWPRPEAAACATLARVMAAVPDGALALVDGLIASCAPDVMVPEAHRLRLVVLVHMPFGQPGADGGSVHNIGTGRVGAREGRMLSAAAAVVTTSAWTHRRLLEMYALDPTLLHVAEPGVDAAPWRRARRLAANCCAWRP